MYFPPTYVDSQFVPYISMLLHFPFEQLSACLPVVDVVRLVLAHPLRLEAFFKPLEIDEDVVIGDSLLPASAPCPAVAWLG
jgi:hypothetical protein